MSDNRCALEADRVRVPRTGTAGRMGDDPRRSSRYRRGAASPLPVARTPWLGPPTPAVGAR